MHQTKLLLAMLFSLIVANPLFADDDQGGSDQGVEHSAFDRDAVQDDSEVALQHKAKQPPLKPYPRLLPLRLVSPGAANVGKALEGIQVSLINSGQAAPNARIRLILHHQDQYSHAQQAVLSPDNVKLELWQRGSWKPIELGMVEGSVMGAIGYDGNYSERHKRGGFPIQAGMNKTWRLRMTIDVPGTYSLVAAVSPDNGSRHLAKPANAIIVVQ